LPATFLGRVKTALPEKKTIHRHLKADSFYANDRDQTFEFF
jgi:hypothetical protein